MEAKFKPFFAYATARETIREQRASGAPICYWTADPIFQEYRFCNVFREDDKTTKWFRENIRDGIDSRIRMMEYSSADQDLEEYGRLLIATIAFRWFNRITTGEKIKHILAEGWDSNDIRLALKDHTGPFVTGAYMIKTPTGKNKLDGIIWCVEQIAPRATELAVDFTAENFSLEMAWDTLRQFPYLGDFMAYEIITDLRHTILLKKADDINTWANPGPGAARGLGRIYHFDKDHYDRHNKVDRDTMMEQMRELLEASRDKKLWPFQSKRWEMREVEHTLCEFDKYERVRLGEGRPKEKFKIPKEFL